MAYGYAKPSGDYRSQGILSLLENMASPKDGAMSDREKTLFMDTDTGTDHHTSKNPTRNAGAISGVDFARMAELEANNRALMAGVGIDPNMTGGLSNQELLSKFSQILSTRSTEEQVPVIRNFSRLDDDGKMRMMSEVVANPDLITSYQMQDEIPYSKNLGF
tara:strand:+ start:2658 stop:3143 length:486 start_codon:yes stop_codon:yes gene_type:complete